MRREYSIGAGVFSTVKKIETPQWEVLPPETHEASRGTSELARLLAHVLDDLVRIPGTKIRFGLDPLMSLIPGIGPIASNAASAVIVLQAIKCGVPKIIMARMGANILVNTALDAIPGVGDLISVWFRSNAMNYALLQKHAGQRRSTKGDWLFVYAVIAAIVFVLALSIGAAVLVLREIESWLGR